MLQDLCFEEIKPERCHERAQVVPDSPISGAKRMSAGRHHLHHCGNLSAISCVWRCAMADGAEGTHASCRSNLAGHVIVNPLWLLVDPVELSRLPALDLLRLEPQSNFLLCALDAVGAVADVATDIDGIVTTDSAGGRGKRVGSTEDGAAGLASITPFPDHGDDGTAQHVCDETLEERLRGEIFVVLLKVFL